MPSTNPRITIRWTPSDFSAIKAAARRAGLPMTAYIRDKVLAGGGTVAATNTLSHQASPTPLPTQPVRDQRFAVAAPQNLDRLTAQMEANTKRRLEARQAEQPQPLPDTPIDPLAVSSGTGFATSLGRRVRR